MKTDNLKISLQTFISWRNAKEWRTVSLSAGICAVLREKIMDYLTDRDSLFARIEVLTLNPWKAVE